VARLTCIYPVAIDICKGDPELVDLTQRLEGGFGHIGLVILSRANVEFLQFEEIALDILGIGIFAEVTHHALADEALLGLQFSGPDGTVRIGIRVLIFIYGFERNQI